MVLPKTPTQQSCQYHRARRTFERRRAVRDRGSDRCVLHRVRQSRRTHAVGLTISRPVPLERPSDTGFGDRVESWGIDDFFTPRETLLTDGSLRDFHEWETSGKTTSMGNIATRESHYRKTGVLNGSPYEGEGRKFIQLCRTGERWAIVSVLWEDV